MSPTIDDTVRERAANDLDCPRDKISTYPAAGGLWVARGCYSWTQYTCFSARGSGPVCSAEPIAQVNSDPGDAHPPAATGVELPATAHD